MPNEKDKINRSQALIVREEGIINPKLESQKLFLQRVPAEELRRGSCVAKRTRKKPRSISVRRVCVPILDDSRKSNGMRTGQGNYDRVVY